MNKNKTNNSAILTEVILDFMLFPFWWYAKGLLQTLVYLQSFLSQHQKSLGLSVWLKNIFKPMYGQNDFAGSLISFLIRLVQIIFRSMAMLFWLVIALIIFLFWVLLPIAVIYEIGWQLKLI